uniref:Granzyme A-like protein n=1 Tax=Callorhinchus milii TaxID=7868 RepID=K4G3R8_CALMI|nr:granzyme A-like precursor [Callorhinchus milii]AFM86514.1 granzyme A-like protein [Callorhinchus milii]
MLLTALISSLTIIFSLTPGYGCVEIIGGHDVPSHSRPYMASIQVNRKHKCGGALIKPAWVLTAAHCADGKPKLNSVVLGIDSLRENTKTKQVFKIKKEFPHRSFDRNTKENDIMLLQLDRAVDINKFVSILRLPKRYSDLKAGTHCTVAGWGITKEKSTTPSNRLKEVNITIVDRGTCNDKDHYNDKPKVTANMLCAGDKNGNDACEGDSGGPLICNNKYSGNTSFGIGCGKAKYPGIYTALTNKYLDWIKKITAPVSKPDY